MTALTVRKLEVDLSTGFDTHWVSGNAFLSQFHNALSMSFPGGEQAFIDAVRAGLERLPDTPANAALRTDAAQFIGQEATHRHLHGLYNEQLEKQGLVNRWQHWLQRRVDYGRAHNISSLHLLAITAAFEHCTAVFADFSLRHSDYLDAGDARLRTLWLWHAAEETEHCSVAFDLYQVLGGNYRWRVIWFLQSLFLFSAEVTCQTVLNLWHTRSLFKLSTAWQAARFLFGRQGLVWYCALPMLKYLRRDFHPAQDTATPSAQALAQNWLRLHRASYRVVR